MKNKRVCINKSTGFIALLGIVLVAVVLAMNYPTGTAKQTMNTKAFLNCPNSSLIDLTNLCPDVWKARDASGQVIMASGPLGGQHPCCYLNTNYTGTCPNGSSPDPNKWCASSNIIPGKFVTRISDNKQVQCCNWIDVISSNNGPLQGTPAPVLTQAAVPTVMQQLINTNAPYILQDAKYCTSLGLFQVPTVIQGGYTVPKRFVNDYYAMYCKKYENIPQWNGTYGKGALCYTATGVCAGNANCDSTSCLRGQSATEKCLNIPVAFSKCVTAGKAPTQADPATPDDKRCTGTCASSIAIGSCAPGYARRCACTYATTGQLFPRYIDDANCAPPAKTCLTQVAEWTKPGAVVCGGYAAYNACTKDKYRCICDSAGTYKYPTLQKDFGTCP